MLLDVTIETKLKTGEEALLFASNDLIMLHTNSLSAQWNPHHIGVRTQVFSNLLKVGFFGENNNYQAFYFDLDKKKEIENAFVSLGFRKAEHVDPQLIGYIKDLSNRESDDD